VTILTHKFVTFIPSKKDLEDDVLYISLDSGTVIHKCCCGCGNEVVTPLSPTDWNLTFDGETISLYPSIGNWSFKCQSHYWIKNSKVIKAGYLPKSEIEKGRRYDIYTKQKYFKNKKKEEPSKIKASKSKLNWWSGFMGFLKHLNETF